MPKGRESERLIALVAGAAFAFNYPLLSLFSADGTLLGIPLLFVYLFCSWLTVIVLTALLMERRSAGPGSGDGSPEAQSLADE